MALPFGLLASYPRSVRHSPVAHAGFRIDTYFADHLLGAAIVSDYPVFIARLAFDILGSLTGAALVACWGLGEWPLRRGGN